MGALRFGAGALGLTLDLASSVAWGLAAFFVANSLFSTTVGGLLGIAISFSAFAFMLSMRLQESRAKALLADSCPRCQTPLRREHEHRRWETERGAWLAPLTTWECASCGYGHSEPVPCERCPEPA